MRSKPASRSGSRLHLLAAALLLAVLPATPGRALDRTILGKRLVVTNPKPDPGRRQVIVVASEAASPETVVGDPTAAGGAGGAVLHVVANGANGVVRRYELPQGTGPGGRALWRATRGGYRYAEPEGAQGPVRSVVVGRRADRTFVLRAVLTGRHAPLDVVPPAPGTDGFVTLKLGAGDRYCARFGREGRVRNRADRLWKVERPTVEGCPPFGELLALSYNVAGLPEGLSGSHPATNTPIISPLLNRYDLVLVQESWQTPDPNPFAPTRVYHELLVADATHAFKSVSAPLPLGSDPARPTALVSDGLNWMSRYPFAEVVRVPWDGCHQSAADCLAFKGFAVARTTLAAGVTVDVYDLHMEAGGDPEDDQLRRDGVNQLAAFMATFSAGRPVIIGGDFNLHTDEEPDATTFETLLALSGLEDVCETLGCPEPGRIDKFLFRSNDTVRITPRSWRFETDLFVDPAGEPLSDHDALAVRFAWELSGG